MNRFLIVLSFLLPLQVALAQNSELSGIVKDSLSTTAIAYASVGLLDANNKVVDGMITDSSGNFNFSNLQSGKYNLTVKFIGYNQKRLAIEIRNQKTINLGNILISLANNNLEQVTVTAGMAGQKHSSDRQTYQASQYKNAVGGTALDIVKNLPSAS